MRKFFKTVIWIVFNGAFLALLLYGLQFHCSGALNLALFYYWIGIIAGPFTLTETYITEAVKKSGNYIPPTFELCYDLVIVGIFAWYGWFFTAFCYTFFAFVCFSSTTKINKLRKLNV